jgi:Caspase domain
MSIKTPLTAGWLAALALCAVPDFAAAARVALVIGNDAYTHVTRLNNAGNDARLMAAALKEAGFDVVGGVRLNLDRKAMWKALDDFQIRIAKGDEVVFYYAGHGVQIEANSLLLPVDIEAENDDQVARDGINIVAVQDEVKNARFALMVIDACRDNPFPPKPGHTRGIGSNAGIVPIEPAHGNVILLSASRNQQALDEVPGVTKSNGLFTYTLVQAMRIPGVDVIDAMHTVRQQVERQARMANPPHEQRPALVEEMDGQFAFFPKSGAIAAPSNPVTPPAHVTAVPIKAVRQTPEAPTRLTAGGPYPGWATTNLLPGIVGNGTVTVNADGTIDSLTVTGDRTHGTLNLSDPNNVTVNAVTHLGNVYGVQIRYPDGSTSTQATLTGRLANGKISGTWSDKFQHGQFEWTVGPSD